MALINNKSKKVIEKKMFMMIIIALSLTGCGSVSKQDYDDLKNSNNELSSELQKVQNDYANLQKEYELLERSYNELNNTELETDTKTDGIVDSPIEDDTSNTQPTENGVIILSKNNPTPVIYQNKSKTITVTSNMCKFAGDIQIMQDIVNSTGEDIYITIADIKIDSVSLNAITGFTPIYSGQNIMLCHTILADDIRAAGIEDFSELHCNINILDKNTDLIYQQPIVIMREVL